MDVPFYTVGVASVVVAILALIPATLLIIIAELRAIRSRAFYMGCSVVVLLPSQLGLFYQMDFFRDPSAVLLFGSCSAGWHYLPGTRTGGSRGDGLVSDQLATEPSVGKH